MINSDLFIFDKEVVILIILFTKCQILIVIEYSTFTEESFSQVKRIVGGT